jgi:probable F420-dependent oxidoreductase
VAESIVPEGSLAYGMQLPIQTLTRLLREPWEDGATVDDLVAVARAADAAGFAFIGVCDHVALPHNDYTAHMSTTWFDPFTTLAYLARATEQVRLASTVLVPAYRHPLASAKSFLTLDHLSGGRAIVGVGAGHVEGEFEALDVDFATRGERLNECIDAMRGAFRSEYSEFTGRQFAYGPVGLAPRPVHGDIPIWVGGSGPAALRRAGERGDGWIPAGTPRDQMQSSVDLIRAHRDRTRPGAALDLGFMPEPLYVGDPAWEVGPRTVCGPAGRVAESLRAAHDWGCGVLHLRFRSRSSGELCDQMAAFGHEVAPLLAR